MFSLIWKPALLALAVFLSCVVVPKPLDFYATIGAALATFVVTFLEERKTNQKQDEINKKQHELTEINSHLKETLLISTTSQINQCLAALLNQIAYKRKKFIPLRANIMIMNDEALKIIYHINMHDMHDLKLELKINQGCAGKSFISKKPIFCEPKRLNEKILREKWNLSIEQIRMTKHLGSILSMPILTQEDEVIGILNIDSTEYLSKSCFDKRWIQEMCAITATKIREALMEQKGI